MSTPRSRAAPQPRLWTVSEVAAFAQSQRRSQNMVCWAMLLAFTTLGGWAIASGFSNLTGMASLRWAIPLLLGCAVLAIAVLGALGAIYRRTGPCPHCGARQDSWSRWKLILAGRHCPDCGGRMIDSTSIPKRSATDLLDREDLSRGTDSIRKCLSRRILGLVVIPVFFAVIYLIGATQFGTHPIKAPDPESVTAPFGPFVWTVPATFLAQTIVWRVVQRRISRIEAHCPSCKAALGVDGNLALLTENCPSCGTGILPRREEPVSSDLLTPAAYLAAVRAFQRSQWPYLVGGNTAFVVGLCVSFVLVVASGRADHGPQTSDHLVLSVLFASMITGFAILASAPLKPPTGPLQCPNCPIDLQSPVNSASVLATHRCPKCRKRMLTDNEGKNLNFSIP